MWFAELVPEMSTLSLVTSSWVDFISLSGVMLFLEIVPCFDHLSFMVKSNEKKFMVKYVSYYSKVLFKLFAGRNFLLWDKVANVNSNQWSI